MREEERQRSRNQDQASKTIQQFCELEGLSPSSYYKMRRDGYGPDEIRVPGTEIIRITPEAHRAWRERMAKLSQSQASDLERKRRASQRRAAGLISAVKRSRGQS